MVFEHREPHLLAALKDIFQIVLMVRLLGHGELVGHVVGSVVRLKLVAARNNSEGKILRLVVMVGLRGPVQPKLLLEQVQFAKLGQLGRYLLPLILWVRLLIRMGFLILTR
jgi:hypothetical protein